MSLAFGREKRLLLGTAALLAPLPLPLNQALEWPFLAAYAVAMGYFLLRAHRDAGEWLSTTAMNVLGLAYLPFFFVDLTMLGRGRLVGPVLHLGLFAILIKLFALRRERDKWQALVGIFFLFLAAMATSVHPSVVLFLIAFMALALLLLTRFAHLHLLTGFGQRDPARAGLPLGGFLTFGVLFTVVLSVPLFALLPRVTTPYIGSGGAGTGTIIGAMGFSDEVTLDSIGRIRESREVAMRLMPPDGRPLGGELRLKAATFDTYDGRRWIQTSASRRVNKESATQVRLTPGPVRAWLDVWLRPLGATSLPLPVTTRLVDVRRYTLEIGAGGAVHMTYRPRSTMEYRVGVGDAPLSAADPPDFTPDSGALDLGGLTPRMAELAADVMGEGPDGERARRLEQFFIQEYFYTLDFVGRRNDNPLEEFLFVYKSGHCEYFASAMVLLLRSQGIPARLSTGFLGGDFNPLQGYYIVRQSNAHAWVEAWLPDSGWTVLDPTPPSGRPAGERLSAWSLATQAWDFVVFRWDRYVLSYGFGDQVQLFGTLRDLWARLWSRDRAPAPQPAVAAAEAEAGDTAAQTGDGGGAAPWLAAVLLLLASAAAIWLARRGPLTGGRAYQRLRRELGRRGVEVPDSLPPLRLTRRTARRCPPAAAPAGRVVDLYLREAFAEERLGETERRELKAALGEATRALRKAG